MDERVARRKRWVGLAAVALLVLGTIVGFAQKRADEGVARLTHGAPYPSDSQVGDETQATDRTFAAAPTAGSGDGATKHQGAADIATLPSTTIPSSVAAGGATANPAPTTGVDQKIVKNGTVRLQVNEGGFRGAFDAASRVAAAHGGFVVSTESSAEKDKQSSGVLVLRIPVAAFDAARADLGKLGEVKEERIAGQDVSGQLVDLDARIRSLTAQEDAIRVLMAKAKTIGETVEVQNHLTSVRQQIEQLSGEKARLENQAALSTLRVEVFEPGAARTEPKPEGEPSTLRQAVTSAVDGAETVVAGTIIVLGWGIPLAVLLALVYAAYRPFGRRRLALALATATPADDRT